MNNCRAGKGRAGRDVLPAQQVGLKCQSLLTGHHVGHDSALGQVVGDIRKKCKSRVVGIADVCCETVSLRTSCERVHTNPTVLDAAKKGRTNLIALHFQKQKSNRSCGPKKGWRLAYNCKPFGAPRRPLACLHARLLACSLAPLNRIELGLGYPTQACSLMVGSRVDGSNVVVAMHNYRGCACNVGHGNGNAQPSWMVGSKEGVWWWR